MKDIRYDAKCNVHPDGDMSLELDLVPLVPGLWDIELTEGGLLDWILDFKGTEQEALDHAATQFEIEIDESTRRETT